MKVIHKSRPARLTVDEIERLAHLFRQPTPHQSNTWSIVNVLLNAGRTLWLSLRWFRFF